VVVGAIESRVWNAGGQPVEECLVAGVHTQCDVRLPSVAAEVSFAHQETDQEAAFAWGEVEHLPSMAEGVSPSGFPWNVLREPRLFHRQVSRGTARHPPACGGLPVPYGQ